MSPPSSAADAASHPDDWMNMLDHIMDGDGANHHHDSGLSVPDHLVHHGAPASSSAPNTVSSTGNKSNKEAQCGQGTVASDSDASVALPSVAAASAPPVATVPVTLPSAAASVALAAPAAAEAVAPTPPSAVAAVVSHPSSAAALASAAPPAPAAPPSPAAAAPSAVATPPAATAQDTPATAKAPAPSASPLAASKPGSCGAAVGGTSDAENSSSLGGACAEARAQARSERKRTREKQRRLDVNAQFASLTTLLRKIEQEDLAADAEENGGEENEKHKSTLGFLNAIGRTGCPTNRADLIAMTICVLERLHAQNGRLRKDRTELRSELEDSRKKGEELAQKHKQAEAAAQQVAMGAAMQPPAVPKQDKVMMMVPMMVTPDQVAGIHNVTHGMQMPFPFVQNMLIPQISQQHAPAVSRTPSTSAPLQASHTQPAPTAAVAASGASLNPALLSQSQPQSTPVAPAPSSHPPSVPPNSMAPQSLMHPGGFPMMMPNPGGFFFNNSKLPAQPTPHVPPMPNSMLPSTMPGMNPFSNAFGAMPPASVAPGAGQAPSGQSSHPPAPPQQPAASSSSSEQKPKEQKQNPPHSPSMQGGQANQFPPPPPGGAPGGGSSGSAGSSGGGGGGNLAHCA